MNRHFFPDFIRGGYTDDFTIANGNSLCEAEINAKKVGSEQ